METEKLKEKWIEICFLLCVKINNDVREELFEKEVLLVLEKLGWRQYKREIAIKPRFSVGSKHTIVADFVLYDKNNKAVVVVEVKRPSEDITSPKIIEQLTSYMRQAKVDLGLLIGNQIHIYYEGNLYPHNESMLLSKIKFEEDSKDGLEFVTIFEKDIFLEKNSGDGLKQWILKQIITSDTTKDKTLAFLKNEFAGFGADVFNDTIKEFELIVSPIGFSGKVNKVGEATNNLFTKEKQVRRRVFKIDERRSSVEGVKPKGRPRYSTNRQSAWVSNNRFNIQYADGKSQNWPLPLHGDKDGLRKVLYEALKFGTESGASKGQLDAIRKELNKEGYYLIK